MARRSSWPGPVLAAVALAATACADDGSEGEAAGDRVDPAPDDHAAAERNMATLRRLYAIHETRDYDSARELFSPDYRERAGSRFAHFRDADPLAKMIATWKSDGQQKFPQLVLAGARRGLDFSIATNVWASRRKKHVGAYAYLRHYRFEDGAIRSQTYWYDVQTVYHQAGVPGIEGVPDAEPRWPGAPIEVIAAGDAHERAEVDRVRELVAAVEAGDAAKIAGCVTDGFVDRDLTRAGSVRYSSRRDFEAAAAAELGRVELSRIKVLDAWAAGPWAVAELGHSFRLDSGAAAQVYKLWLLRFDDGGLIRERWRMRGRWSEMIQLGEIDFFDLIKRKTAVD